MNFFFKGNIKRHNFHIVDPSPWPLVMAWAAFILTSGGVLYMHKGKWGGELLFMGFIFVITTMAFWFRDVIREGTFEGYHTKCVQQGLIYGMVLFIVSEVMFFAAFFWAFFHSSLAPTIQIGGTWPPYGLWEYVINPFDVPLLNTVILLISGATITWAHHSIIANNYKDSVKAFNFTILLAIMFIIAQVFEYITSTIDITDGIYGSCFFLLTGFHGFHVVIGTIFIVVCYLRYLLGHFSPGHHIGFTSAAWYWHFVDVVWLFLFIFVYIWGHWEPEFIIN
mgnify:CR=1 FL=1